MTLMQKSLNQKLGLGVRLHSRLESLGERLKLPSDLSRNPSRN